MDLIKKYDEIKNPSELLDFMKNINYGYLSNKEKIYRFGDKDFGKNWYDEYLLERPTDVLNNAIGNCWDQVELERDWFLKHNYEIITIYHQVMLEYENPYPTHTFLVYKENNKYYWFENSWDTHRGIHEFNSFDDLLEYEYKKNIILLNNFNINENEISKIKYYIFDKPKSHINASEYIKYVTSKNEIKITHLP